MKKVSEVKEIHRKTSGFWGIKKLINRNLILFLFILTACGKSVPQNNFDAETWQKDEQACNDTRKALLPELDKIKPDLLGLHEKKLQKFLGKPDGTSLTDQSERIYFYYIEPGPQCAHKSYLSSANKLQIRMNSMGFVIEINYEQPVKK